VCYILCFLISCIPYHHLLVWLEQKQIYGQGCAYCLKLLQLCGGPWNLEGLKAVFSTSLTQDHSQSTPGPLQGTHPRNCHSCKPQFVAFEKFCVLWQWKLRFILRFLRYFGLISTNVDKALNIYDAVRRHCIPKPFVHTVMMLDVSGNDKNDATQGPSHASIANNQMVRD